MMFGSIDKRPAFTEYFGRLSSRPAAIRARELDDALMPDQSRPKPQQA
jgi:glutathione S-transferase